MKKIIIVPDSFKGTLSAKQVSKLIKISANKHFPEAECVEVPLADGGEGTLDAIIQIMNGVIKRANVSNPLGEEVSAKYGIAGDTAIIELAQASGLTLISADKLNPLKASTYGTGELIHNAIELGYKKLIVCLGGSGTNDGGTGLMRALGMRFLDIDGKELIDTDEILTRMEYIEAKDSESLLAGVTVECLCDVDVPLTGAGGATDMFGAQKGVTSKNFDVLEEGLKRFSRQIERQFGVDVSTITGAGAAGGAATSLCVFFGAKMKSGIEKLLDLIKFDELLSQASLVITGEGRLDEQSCQGKLVSGVAQRSYNLNVPAVVLAGSLGKNYHKIYELGVTAVTSCMPSVMNFEEVLQNAENIVAEAADRMFRTLKTGSNLSV